MTNKNDVLTRCNEWMVLEVEGTLTDMSDEQCRDYLTNDVMISGFAHVLQIKESEIVEHICRYRNTIS